MGHTRILTTKRLYWMIYLLISFSLVSYATAHEKVVVVPLLGEEATGNATQEDVLNGKTFSNSTATGLTGTRPPAPVAKTGQTVTYRTGDDGYHEKGQWMPYPWIDPRFDVGITTVTHNLTGLKWQRSASNGLLPWNEAIDYCNAAMIWEDAGGGFSILYDDWRLPNIRELKSLIDYKYTGPALSNVSGSGQYSAGNPFNQVLNGWYWSSTTVDIDKSEAWGVWMDTGAVVRLSKTGGTQGYLVWCVTGGI